MDRVDSVLAMLLAPIMAHHQRHINGGIFGGSMEVRIESKKGDRDQTDGLTAAQRFLASAGAGGSCARAEVPAPPDPPVHTLKLQSGVETMIVVGDAGGRAWATGANLSLLAWPIAKWGDDPVVHGRAQLNPEGGWEARKREAEATQTRKRAVVAEPQGKKQPAKKTMKVEKGQRSMSAFFG